ncbi:hypothetical protein TREMEDRAFT_68552 [Tremella mesenterica DSM 1558]|uniref:uncharacterized protein n=1 Tax=Tremella mesenterica (strain ATCC 24925 / CBS 8224 / DSM 1558 / NBRC 9311 / NRRL Y-6157 / RJB 2259-6 / UBC 559-6) TaxID=578456 RepID=UPI0003F49CEB|nr:uncharacterized protein TREMEDRAFT_68552 [Tremella mesenterica DSM 1558]EIW70221.1 hypothetical protein TREMEDRAFT_68552 [Tremella mesenterica DSM 1558]
MSDPTSSRSTISPSSMSCLVLLPSATHAPLQPSILAHLSRPAPLISRQSGSTVPTTRHLSNSASSTPQPDKDLESQAIDHVISAGRRLSLAPGIGTGTQTLSTQMVSSVSQGSPDMSHSPYTSSPIISSTGTSPGASPYMRHAPLLGAKRTTTTKGRSRRPQTSAAAQGPTMLLSPPSDGRNSVALPGGMRGRGSGRNRPGWEGDEVVSVLRASGLEVTPIPVILVPLSDSPSLPSLSLSLLLSQGTTPSAVCFQQDLLDRARRTEEEWLPFAVEQIRTVISMRDRATTTEKPIVIAFSANPVLTQTTTTACVAAGAAGVLKPPYDLETSRLVWRMVMTARETRTRSHSRLGREKNDDPRVILPPTALTFGGEHEGEMILSAAVRKMHKAHEWHSTSRKNSIVIPLSTPASRTHSFASTTPTTAAFNILRQDYEVPMPEASDYHPFLECLCACRPSIAARRQSVDIGGLTIAMKRASRVFENSPDPPFRNKSGKRKEEFTFPFTPSKKANMLQMEEKLDGKTDAERKEEKKVEEEKSTRLAELLGAMWYQTTKAIDIQMADYAHLSKPISPALRTRLLDALSTWNFQPHLLSPSDVFHSACILFDAVLHIKGIHELHLEWDQVRRLLFAIRAIYHAPNPYHNYVHAIDVLQATYSFLIAIGVAPPYEYLRTRKEGIVWQPKEEVGEGGTSRAREVMRPQDVLAVLIAAMGHDIGHPGLSNAFMKNARTPLSQVYDDKSVLENMHCMLVVQLLRKHSFGFLLYSPSETDLFCPARIEFDRRGFRRVLYSTILATDMSLHFAWIARLKEFTESLDSTPLSSNSSTPTSSRGMDWPRDEEEDRVMFCQALIKCADISNPTRPIDVSEHWSSVLLEEWAIQASLEQELDLPVSVIASADAALQAKGQVGFIDLFTLPLFEAVADVLPELQCYAILCAENRDLWQKRLQSFSLDSQQAATKLIQPAVEAASRDARFKTLFPLSLPISLVEEKLSSPSFPNSISIHSTSSSLEEETSGVSRGSKGEKSNHISSSIPNSVSALAEPDTPRLTTSFNFPFNNLIDSQNNLQSDDQKPDNPPPYDQTLVNSQPNITMETNKVESPAAKAMRAVYHANLLDQRHRLGSWCRGVPIPGLEKGWVLERRMSTPVDGVSMAV